MPSSYQSADGTKENGRGGFCRYNVAFLLAMRQSAPISRYENFKQRPNLETAISLEILFQTPVREIFAGVSESIERKIESRATLLARELERRGQNSAARRKLAALDHLLENLGRTPAQSA